MPGSEGEEYSMIFESTKGLYLFYVSNLKICIIGLVEGSVLNIILIAENALEIKTG